MSENSEISKSNPLEQIYYISLPEEMNDNIGSFNLDPSILLPVESPEGKKEWAVDDLNWEMIISAMLKILAYQPFHEDADYYRQFIPTIRPEITEELNHSAVMKARSHDYPLSEEIFLALRGLNPESQKSMINLALLYDDWAVYNKQLGQERDFEKHRYTAERFYNELLTQDSVIGDVYYHAGWHWYNQENFKKTVELFSSYVQMGEKGSQQDEAVKILKEIKNGNLTDSLYSEAYNLIKSEKVSDGLKKISEFLEINVNVWNAWFLKGWGLRKLDLFEEALICFIKADELNNKNSDILNELAICYTEADDPVKAIKTLEKALLQDPENIKILSNMGIVHMRNRNKEEAMRFFMIVLEMEPEDQIVKQYIELLQKN